MVIGVWLLFALYRFYFSFNMPQLIGHIQKKRPFGPNFAFGLFFYLLLVRKAGKNDAVSYKERNEESSEEKDYGAYYR